MNKKILLLVVTLILTACQQSKQISSVIEDSSTTASISSSELSSESQSSESQSSVKVNKITPPKSQANTKSESTTTNKHSQPSSKQSTSNNQNSSSQSTNSTQTTDTSTNNDTTTDYSVNLPQGFNDSFVSAIQNVDYSMVEYNTVRYFSRIFLDVNNANYPDKIYFLSEFTNKPQYGYRIVIETIPTIEITVKDQFSQKRKIKTNTKITIWMDPNDEQYFVTSDFDSEPFYLFYNRNGSISLAVRNFSENPLGEAIDTNNMIEYVQEEAYNSNIFTLISCRNYYNYIHYEYQRQLDYRNSLDDPNDTQSPTDAAILESEHLKLVYPEDTQLIEEALQQVINP